MEASKIKAKSSVIKQQIKKIKLIGRKSFKSEGGITSNQSCQRKNGTREKQ